MTNIRPTIAILGASGLIGEAVARALDEEGFPIVAMARRFSAAQKYRFAETGIECPLVELGSAGLAAILAEKDVDIVINCVGVLQDGARGGTQSVHADFIEQLLVALGAGDEQRLLLQISIPGRSEDDKTSFSRSKRLAEKMICDGPGAYVILRPGFVISPVAYGGSALIRATAALPVNLALIERQRPLRTTAMGDIVKTVCHVAKRWRAGEHDWHAVWDVMSPQATNTGEVIDGFRAHFGGPVGRVRLPMWLIEVSAKAADFAGFLGWSAPIRSTALAELRRGVEGNPEQWMAQTSIEATTFAATMRGLPASVQEKWFARLYLLKALMVGTLALFWVVSGLIAISVAFDAAVAVLTSHGFLLPLARAFNVVTSLVDIAVGLAIATKKTCRRGLVAGIAVSLFYVVGTLIVAPELWGDPLGALVKTGLVVVLMLVTFSILDDR